MKEETEHQANESRVRNVLLVSYHVPPRESIGTVRTRQLIAHLPAEGWHVTAFTARLEGAAPDVVQSDYTDYRAAVKRLIGLGDGSAHATLGVTPASYSAQRSWRQRAVELGFAITGYPDGMLGWFPGARKALRHLLATTHFDAIISSAPPFTTNLVLGSLRLRVPWIADFRDLWADTDIRQSRIHRFCDSALERWSLRHASAVTTISEPMARALHMRYPRMPIRVIPNAFDAADWNGMAFDTEPRCTILYAGSFYDGRRDPRLLFSGLRSLIDDGSIGIDEVCVDIYSPPEAWLSHMIAEYRLEDIARVRKTLKREEILAAERRADRLLVVLWGGPGLASEGTVTGKLFEYLGARRRIIALGGPPRSAVDQILADTNAGIRCTDEISVRRELLRAIEEHRRNNVQVLDEQSVSAYSSSALGAHFAELLDTITSKAQRSSNTPLPA